MGDFNVQSAVIISLIKHNIFLPMKKVAYILILLGGVGETTGWAQKTEKGKETFQRVQNTVMIDTINQKQSSVQEMAQKVVEATYKSFPQQTGQPTIIINNIIIPSEASKAVPAPALAPVNPPVTVFAEDKEYQEWLREKYRRQTLPDDYKNKSARVGDGKTLTFKERFGEINRRKSGTWIIPIIGLHASDFNIDFKDGNYTGRTGFNAGVDVRIRTQRFFIQPGIHYFNSSTQVSNKDSLNNARLTDGPRVQSLKVPLMVGIYLTRGDSGFFKFNIKGGGVANYLLAVDNNSNTNLRKENLNEWTYGVNAGIGLEFGFITLDVTHEWGLTNYFKNDSQKNNILRVSLGFKI